jgi:hypothetical protein
MRRTFIAVRASLPLVAALVAASCSQTDSPSAPEATAPETTAPDSPTALDTLATADSGATASLSYSGIAFGPYGLYSTVTEFEPNASPFTGSIGNSFANSIVQRIAAARQQRHRLVLSMTGGSNEYITSGKFDLGKWKARMNTFNTATIKKAVADAVADGTVVGNKLIDEPETPKWGGVLTKPMLDGMATYAKNMFPTLPVGVAYGTRGYQWRTNEQYRVVDWTLSQYMWVVTKGNVTAWRDAVLSRARADGVTPVFSLNLLDGGYQDTSGAWDCPNTGGKGTFNRYCRMTADQVRSWGQALGPYGCVMLAWRYDDAFMARSTNQSAFRDVSSMLNSKPRRSCKRP